MVTTGGVTRFLINPRMCESDEREQEPEPSQTVLLKGGGQSAQIGSEGGTPRRSTKKRQITGGKR